MSVQQSMKDHKLGRSLDNMCKLTCQKHFELFGNERVSVITNGIERTQEIFIFSTLKRMIRHRANKTMQQYTLKAK